MNKKSTMTGLRELMIPGIIQYMTTVMLGFLGIHTGFMILFLYEKLPIMVVIEILSLISYVMLLLKLHFKITRYDTDILSRFVTFSSEAQSYEDFFKLGDSRLYWGKQHGKNRVVFQEQN